MTAVAVSPDAETANELLQNLRLDSQSTKAGDNQEAISSHSSSSSDSNGDASVATTAGNLASTNGTYEYAPDTVIYYAPTGYSTPQPYMYDFSQGGFDATIAGDWEEYPRYVSMDGVEFHPSGLYGENAPVIFQPTSYGYAAQPTYGPYSPAAAVPTIGPDGQLYGPTAFQYSGPFYQPNLSPNAQYLPPASMMIAGDLVPTPLEASSPGVDFPGGVMTNGSIVALGPRPGYPVAVVSPHSPYVRGVVPLALHSPGAQDVRVGYETFRASPPTWIDVPKFSEAQQRPSNPGAPRPTVSVAGHSSQTLRPITPLQVRVPSPQSPQVPNVVTSSSLGPGSLSNGYPPLARATPTSSAAGRGRGVNTTSQESKSSGHGVWIGVDKSKLRERGLIGNGNGFFDISSEQNRGPRTARTLRPVPMVLRQTRGQFGGSSGTDDTKSALPMEKYNRPDFPVTYDDANFYIIKSYSEDDVHKSIKYDIWASTANGNRRLDEAYREAQARAAAKKGTCPVFLLFSVNASGQFCGLAEMTGAVDFFKSVDYWQQDKWNGQFPVKWHIIKDVPNSQFRHIILKNNENKPVTNSRDTQEVKFEQGIEMLNIFKSYPLKTSILDDFQFYENRQKAMEDKRSRQLGQEQNQQENLQGAIDSRKCEMNVVDPKFESKEVVPAMKVNGNVEALEIGTLGGRVTSLSPSSEVVASEGSSKNESRVVSVPRDKESAVRSAQSRTSI
ncbi:hypothetical protein O6H91_17G035500 [Diphasiastrum complanatum]|uniref:Uncharacterized protein n=1 Tax=Diphasiastrum complanatum TaxID=34168 RepID=A0ACC2B5S7_DIPCM|nr:hypothetical protein O6H91_17G035500 [Diphasiastrum complanatum]